MKASEKLRKMTRFGLFVALAWVGVLEIHAQNAKYLVLLKDKNSSPFSVDKPSDFLSTRAIERRTRQGIKVTSRDLPVNPSYLTQIRQTGAKVWYSSRWLNAVLIEASTAQLASVRNLSFVKGLEFNRALANARISAESQLQATQRKFGTEALSYGASQNQIQMLGIDKMHDQNYDGAGMLIGIFDGGFRNSNTNPALKKIFDEKRVVNTYDFVKNEASVYEDDSHGHNVFTIMAGFQEGGLIGPAYGASYVLLRTEDAATETRLEEANWLFAAEYADSLGVDIINTSLGYSWGFDNPADDYLYSQMDGKTALITRAANWAAATGMLVVVAAGNEGNAPWRYISAPADADSVLAIGAVTSQKAITAFSSWGPTADGRVKPDVCAQGQLTVYSSFAGTITAGNGTSYSSPLIAGLVAAFWQSQPALTAAQVIDCIRRAGDRYSSPSPQYGYGIPTFEAATNVARTQYPIMSAGGDAYLRPQAYIYPNPVGASSTLTVHWGQEFKNKKVEIQLVDVSGKVFLRQAFQTIEAETKLPLPILPSGSYFLKMNDNQRERVLKVIK
ncbi:S8 family serine peptidase [Runella zeae]|uniref:S8 family serine peptidase n=1 Tax=Runella zeae TaxID=94255 RepID=UPI000686B1BF|nr:S8 family serine peptidase [Runella zeae]